IDGIGARLPMPVAAEVERDLEEPRRESPCGIEAWRGTDGAQPGVLVEIIDVLPAGVPVDELEERSLPAPRELRERRVVSARDCRDERLVGRHRAPGGAVSRLRPPGYEVRVDAVRSTRPV